MIKLPGTPSDTDRDAYTELVSDDTVTIKAGWLPGPSQASAAVPGSRSSAVFGGNVNRV
jgi:hypothetical protein